MNLEKILGVILAILAATGGIILSQQRDITINTVEIKHNKESIKEIKTSTTIKH